MRATCVTTPATEDRVVAPQADQVLPPAGTSSAVTSAVKPGNFAFSSVSKRVAPLGRAGEPEPGVRPVAEDHHAVAASLGNGSSCG